MYSDDCCRLYRLDQLKNIENTSSSPFGKKLLLQRCRVLCPFPPALACSILLASSICRRPPLQPGCHYHPASSSKLWGISLGVNLEQVWQAKGKRPLPIAFDNIEHTMQPIINKVKYFTRLVGNKVKFTVPPCYPSWTKIPEEQHARLRSIIKSYFDLQDDRSSNEYRRSVPL
ncbi:Uncharacterized protein Adt_33345 [Abeliophyllum distichum]|uniref:Uncharacterized protein n=1 Tax=Abeliophyllum distichum TaxID=126358 RepID=A0ABD1QVZ7_9LAMI